MVHLSIFGVDVTSAERRLQMDGHHIKRVASSHEQGNRAETHAMHAIKIHGKVHATQKVPA